MPQDSGSYGFGRPGSQQHTAPERDKIQSVRAPTAPASPWMLPPGRPVPGKGHSLPSQVARALVESRWVRSEMREKPGCAGPTQGHRGSHRSRWCGQGLWPAPTRTLQDTSWQPGGPRSHQSHMAMPTDTAHSPGCLGQDHSSAGPEGLTLPVPSQNQT